MAKKITPPPKHITATSFQPIASTPTSRFMKQLGITLAACFALLLVSRLQRHQTMFTKFETYTKEAKQIRTISEDELMGSRHGENYAVPMEMTKTAKENDIFLLPPKEYIVHTHEARKQTKNPNNWSNPYIFYYFTDKVRTCPWNNDTLRKKATLALLFNEQRKEWGVVPIKHDSILQHVLQAYKIK